MAVMVPSECVWEMSFVKGLMYYGTRIAVPLELVVAPQ